MLFQVGGQGARPTFFEMAAAQQLPSSLRAALTYSLGVLALRRAFLHKILDFEDEFFALLMLALETHSLRTTDASFAESLYGLRRRVVKIKPDQAVSSPESVDRFQNSGLGKHQKVLSVAFLVVLPYFKSKLHSIYNKEREARLQASLWGEDREDDSSTIDASYFADQGGISSVRVHPVVGRSSMAVIRKKIMAVTGVCYPWIHATNEAPAFFKPKPSTSPSGCYSYR